MNIKQTKIAEEISIIQQTLDFVYSGLNEITDPDKKEWALRHMYMATSRLGTLYVLLKEGD